MSSSLVAPTKGAEQTIYCFHGALDILMRSVDGVAGLEANNCFPTLSLNICELGQSGRQGTGDEHRVAIARSDRQDSLPLVINYLDAWVFGVIGTVTLIAKGSCRSDIFGSDAKRRQTDL